MLLQGKILRNLFIGMTALNAVLIGLFFYVSAKQPWLPGTLFPGKFGPGISLEFTGNMVVLSLLLLINALVVTMVGFKDCLHAMWAGMRLSPRTMRKFLNEKAGLAPDISGIVAAAVQEEEKLELTYIDRAGWVLRIGLLLFAIAMPLTCISLVRAEAGGAPMFAVEQIAVPNANVSNEEIWRFTGDQVAGALLLDIPEIFHLRASRLEADNQNLLFATLILIYRTVIGFGVLLIIVATSRMRALWRYAMEVAMPVRDIVAMEPALAAGRDHTEYRHSREEPSWREHAREHAPVVREAEPVPHHHETAAEAEQRHGVEAEHLREEAHRHELLAEEAHAEVRHEHVAPPATDAHRHHNDDAKAAE